METHPGQGVMKEEKLPNTRKPSHQWVCGEFRNLRGQHNQERKITHTHIHTHTEYALNHICQWRSSPDTIMHYFRAIELLFESTLSSVLA